MMSRMRLRVRKRTGITKIIVGSLLLTLATVAAASLASRESTNLVVVYDTAALERIIGESPKVLVFVEQHACPSCAVLRPYVERLPDRVSGVLVVGYYIDSAYTASRSDTLAFIRAYGIRVTPTLLLFINGSLAGRHEGLFPGDQMDGLMAFVSGAVPDEGESSVEEEIGSTNLVVIVPTATLLGVAAAFSPCSFPLMLSFGALRATSRKSVLMREVGKASAVVVVSVLSAGVLLGWVGAAGVTVLGLPAVDVVALFAAYFSILWGVAEFLGREVVSSGLTAVSGVLPALGLQCSLPFFMTALSLSAGLIPAIATAAGFSLGFSAPYVLASLGFAAFFSPFLKLFGKSGALRGAVLVAVGAYLMYEVFGM